MENIKRDSFFSYRCNGCGRCCFNKRIMINSYDVLRLARNLGVSTGEFVRHYLEKEGPYLRVTADGGCVLQTGKGCGVHADRPLPCRTYPLGRWVSADGDETFRALKPHPQSEGVHGEDGTVWQFLEQQEAQPYLEVTDRYQALFYRLFDALQEELPMHSGLAAETETAMFASGEEEMPAFMEWLDVDRIVERYCKEQNLSVPPEVMKIVDLHIQAIDNWLGTQQGG